MMDLLTRIDECGVSTPERLAHVSDTATLTYGQLIRRANALAASLVRLLPDDGSPVVVLGHKEPEMLIGFLGCVKSGHPYVPVDVALPAQRIEQIMSSSEARLTLTPTRIAELSHDLGTPPARKVSLSDPHYIIYTSGSTGQPKGVVLTLGCLSSFVSWMLAEQRFAAGSEVFLNQAIFAFDLSVMDLYLSLVTGGTLFSITAGQATNPMRLYKALRESNASVWVSTPTFAQFCLAEPTFDETMLPRLSRFLFCGETLAPAVAAQLLDRFPKADVWNTYGPTEATVATTSIRVDREILARYAPLPVGFPLGDSRIVILDENGNDSPPGERGEIVIAGPNVSPGYLNRPDLTERAFFLLDGVRAYRTGDVGFVRDGMLFFVGRKDHQIKLHGYRIELGDVEANLCALPEVRDAVVMLDMKDGMPSFLRAFVVLREPTSDSAFDLSMRLRAQLAQRLPVHMCPRKFHFQESFPLTANGKVDRKKLAESHA